MIIIRIKLAWIRVSYFIQILCFFLTSDYNCPKKRTDSFKAGLFRDQSDIVQQLRQGENYFGGFRRCQLCRYLDRLMTAVIAAGGTLINRGKICSHQNILSHMQAFASMASVGCSGPPLNNFSNEFLNMS
jgi:hypothetical protein